MAKRFEDTDKYRKGFVKGLPILYKVFWDYICLECNHAGIWEVELDVAAVRIGEKINPKEALALFNTGELRVQEICEGRKWLIRPFMAFQYGEGSGSPAFKSARCILEKEGISYPFVSVPEQLAKGPETLMDMDMDKDNKGGLQGGDLAKAQGEPLIEFPLPGTGAHTVTDSHLKDWQEAYPAVDIKGELSKMRVWLLENPRNRKTVKGIPRFIASWLGRAQDRAGKVAQGQGPKTFEGW